MSEAAASRFSCQATASSPTTLARRRSPSLPSAEGTLPRRVAACIIPPSPPAGNRFLWPRAFVHHPPCCHATPVLACPLQELNSLIVDIRSGGKGPTLTGKQAEMKCVPDSHPTDPTSWRQSESPPFSLTFALPTYSHLRAKLDKLTLSNAAIWDREKSRPKIKCDRPPPRCPGAVSCQRNRFVPRSLNGALSPTFPSANLYPATLSAPWIIKAPYYVLCYTLDNLFDGKPIARFWFLETVARMPYFSYIRSENEPQRLMHVQACGCFSNRSVASALFALRRLSPCSMLHLYETLGWWRSGVAVKHVHFAEEYNECAICRPRSSTGATVSQSSKIQSAEDAAA